MHDTTIFLDFPLPRPCILFALALIFAPIFLPFVSPAASSSSGKETYREQAAKYGELVLEVEICMCPL